MLYLVCATIANREKRSPRRGTSDHHVRKKAFVCGIHAEPDASAPRGLYAKFCTRSYFNKTFSVPYWITVVHSMCQSMKSTRIRSNSMKKTARRWRSVERYGKPTRVETRSVATTLSGLTWQELIILQHYKATVTLSYH